MLVLYSYTVLTYTFHGITFVLFESKVCRGTCPEDNSMHPLQNLACHRWMLVVGTCHQSWWWRLCCHDQLWLVRLPMRDMCRYTTKAKEALRANDIISDRPPRCQHYRQGIHNGAINNESEPTEITERAEYIKLWEGGALLIDRSLPWLLANVALK